MHVESFLPSLRLRPFVKSFLVIDSEQAMENRLVPDTSLALAFRCNGQVSFLSGDHCDHIPNAMISGLRRSARVVQYVPHTTNLLVIFREGGASAFFRQPLHELFGYSLPLDALISGRVICEVEEQLQSTTDNRLRVAVVERFLQSRLNPQPDELVTAAVGKIKASAGSIRIRELADKLYISRDAFEKRFRKNIGTSPGHFASIVRLRSVIDNYPKAVSLTDAAYDAGYFDQAHFIKDFKAFTGLTPGVYFKSAARW